MHENFRHIDVGSKMAGILTVMHPDFPDVTQGEWERTIQRSRLDHRWGALTIGVRVPAPEFVPEETKDPLRSLFDWIDALDPVPHVDLEAMGRGEIY